MFLELFDQAGFTEGKLTALRVEIDDAALVSHGTIVVKFEDSAFHSIVLEDTSKGEASWTSSDDGDARSRHGYSSSQ